MTPPRAPRRVSWAIAGRLLRGVAIAFMLVWLAALVAWPCRRLIEVPVVSEGDVVWLRVSAKYFDLADPTFVEGRNYHWCHNAPLSLLPHLLGM